MSIFNKIQLRSPKYSTFDLSHDHKLSLKMGQLVPCNVQECIPGDRFTLSSEGMFRMMPMIAPIMHKVDITIHHFFVPNRILWDNWEKFITGARGVTADNIVPPYLGMSGRVVTPSGLADYMGLPLGNYTGVAASDERISALPFAAYQRIWFDYYRDQNLQDADVYEYIKLADGEQDAGRTGALLDLHERAWEHDYFTSALPFAQKGDAVELPLDIQADITVSHYKNPGVPDKFFNTFGDNPLWDGTLAIDGDQGASLVGRQGGSPTAEYEGQLRNASETWSAEMEDTSTTTTINDLRTAFSLQKWLEKNARGGTRYIESILAHFGVRSSDKRLDRPEYIGGSKTSMAISEVLQTSETVSTPQGTMAGHGIGVTGGSTVSYKCEEHGFIISLLSIRPKTAYMQGLPRHFSRMDRTQYYWPDFAFLGEQPILNKELVLDMNVINNNQGTFGYIPRYSEYRYTPSRVSGEMRTTLKFWHMAREFSGTPQLNSTFISCLPTKRIFAVEDEDQDEIVAHIYHKIRATRPIPLYGNPGGL